MARIGEKEPIWNTPGYEEVKAIINSCPNYNSLLHQELTYTEEGFACPGDSCPVTVFPTSTQYICVSGISRGGCPNPVVVDHE